MPVLLNMSSPLTYSICAINSVLKSIPLEELVGLVNEPLTKTAQILDFDKGTKGSDPFVPLHQPSASVEGVFYNKPQRRWWRGGLYAQ